MADFITPNSKLLDILSNPVIFDVLVPYLTLEALLRLCSTSRSFQNFVFQTPKVFRYLDLSKCRGAYISPEINRIDNGGNSWRAERIDENLTEDEFYAGPLRGVLSRLEKRNVIADVQVLILDELASITNDLIAEIVTRADYNVRILSIRKCVNVNQPKLQQFLKYLCRPERPEGTPKLQGVYFFTDPIISRKSKLHYFRPEGITGTDGATLGVVPVDKSRDSDAIDPWFAPTGQVIMHGSLQRTSWEETLMVCKGVIAFDATLCAHMHAAMSPCLHEASREFLSKHKPGIPTMATIALGSEGCSGCGSAPEGAPVWGQNDVYDFPLLWPPPYSGRLVDAVRPQQPLKSNNDRAGNYRPAAPRLIVSCTWCLANRHCDSCHRWWCGDCYNPKQSKKLADLEVLSNARLEYVPSRDELSMGFNRVANGQNAQGDSVKVFNGFCVENCLVSEMMSGAGSFGMWA